MTDKPTQDDWFLEDMTSGDFEKLSAEERLRKIMQHKLKGLSGEELVARVFVGETDVSLALVEAGLAVRHRYHGNGNSHVYHAPGCRYYGGPKTTWGGTFLLYI